MFTQTCFQSHLQILNWDLNLFISYFGEGQVTVKQETQTYKQTNTNVSFTVCAGGGYDRHGDTTVELQRHTKHVR